MIPLSLDQRKKLYLTVALIIISLLLMIALAISPLVAQIKRSSLALAQNKQTMESFFADWQTLENSRKEYEQIRQKIDSLPALLPKNDAIKFIMFVEEAARATDNQETISVINPAPTTEDKSTKTTGQSTSALISFQINLQGSFLNLMKFLIYLENAPYYNDLETIQIHRLGTNAGSNENIREGDVGTSLKLKVYQQ